MHPWLNHIEQSSHCQYKKNITWVRNKIIINNRNRHTVMSKAITFYPLDGEIKQEVNSSPYLGITFSNDLQWKTHITKL